MSAQPPGGNARPADAGPHGAAAADPVRGGAGRGLAIVAAALALLVLALAGLVAWGGYTTAGAAALLRWVPGLAVSEPRGSLLGGDFGARQLVWNGADGTRVTLADPQWSGLRLNLAGRWAAIRALRASRVQVETGSAPASSTPPALPTDLRLPLELSIEHLAIDELQLAALGPAPIRAISARGIAAGAGGEHRVAALELLWNRLRLNAEARIGTRAPLPLQASVAVAPDPAMQPDWRGHLAVDGPLAEFAAGAALRALRQGDPEPPSLDLSARVRPFDAWPLATLEASAHALDPRLLDATAPHALLDAQAHIATRGWDQPIDVELALTNRAPGRADAGRVPLRSAQIELSGRASQAQRLEFRAFDLELGSADAAAGRITGRGAVALDPASDRLELHTTVEQLQPALLDARASPMTLSGPLDLTLQRLTQDSREASIRADLHAQVPQLPQAGQIAFEARASAQRIELQRLRAAIGAALAEFSGSAERRDAAWQLAGRGKLERFDPRPYWRGNRDPAWRDGAHRLNGNFAFDLALADAAAPRAGLAALAALTGQATLKLADSQLAGVPLAAELALTGRGPQLTLAATLSAGANQLQLDGRVATDARRADADHWQAALQAPALAALQPLLRLAAGDAAPALAGQLQLQASADGRWPALRSSGSASAQALSVPGFNARSLDARWNFAAAADAPLELDVNLAGASLGSDATLDSAHLQARGSWAAHRIELDAASAVRPPAWIEAVTFDAGAPAASAASRPPAASAPAVAAPAPAAAQAAGPAAGESQAAGPASGAPQAAAAASGAAGAPTGSLARLSLQGSLQGGLLAPTGWRGSIVSAEAGARGANGAPRWLSLANVGAAIDLDRATRQPVRVAIDAGRAQVLGAALRWDRLLWQDRADADLLEAHAALDPLPVVPLLRRLQPDFGWGGDLKLRARVDVRSAPTLAADVVLERDSGDLSITDAALPNAPARALDLSDLRFGLVARDGTWSFTQALAGRSLGSAAGAQVVRTDPKALWPRPDATLDGVVQANVADLGGWGAWLPAGWRLAGQIDAGASFGGRFGAPAYTGHVRGSALAVRNLLEGVDVHDGKVAIALQGETARIEEFSARAGDGTLKLAGEASFGSAPRARVELTAARFQVLGRVDRRVVASGSATLALAAREIDLKGKFAVDEGLIDFTRSDAPALSDDVVVLRPTEAAAADPSTKPAARAPQRNVNLDLAVDLGRELRVRGRGIDTLLGGALRISAPAGKLAINGSVRTRSGTYAAYGQKLEIERGELAFSGSPDTPRLDILAIRPNLDVRVGVAVIGTVQAPRVRLYSEPDMADMDKLSWLVLGRAGDELGRTDTALLQRAAMALLAGEGGGPTDAVTQALGLDTLSVRQQSEGDVTQTVVSIGKQLSQRWYVGYERSLNATAGTWQLIYRVAQRFTLRAQGGFDNSLDAIWTWRWQ